MIRFAFWTIVDWREFVSTIMEAPHSLLRMKSFRINQIDTILQMPLSWTRGRYLFHHWI